MSILYNYNYHNIIILRKRFEKKIFNSKIKKSNLRYRYKKMITELRKKMSAVHIHTKIETVKRKSPLKSSVEKSATGIISIREVDPEGKFIELENTSFENVSHKIRREKYFLVSLKLY